MTGRLARWALPLLVLALIAAYAAGRRPVEPFAESRFLMDTLVEITLWGVDPDRGRAALDAAFGELQRVDQEMARVEGSPLWELNRVGAGVLSAETRAVVEAALSWSRRSHGAFDPTMAPLLDLWDIPGGAMAPPEPAELDRALAGTGWSRVRWTGAPGAVDLGGTQLDLGGIAKGYAIDRAAAALRALDVTDFIVNAGGDLYVAGTKGSRRWRVAIQHPRNEGEFLQVVSPLEGALVTSGDYERYYLWEGERIHHILDPRSGRPASGCQSVSVWAPTALDADALATAVFVLGPDDGLALVDAEPAAEALVVAADGSVRSTEGFRRVAPPADRP